MNIRLCNQGEVPVDLLLEADPSLSHIREYVEEGSVYIAEEEEVVGTFVLLPTRPDTVELVNIAVSASHRGKGIGKRLIEAAFRESAGYRRIEVGTGNSSTDQLAFYQKAGFRITGIDHDFFTVHYEEEIWENGILCRDMIRLTREL